MTDPVTVTLPSREHAQRLYVMLDRAQVVGLEAKQTVVEIMKAIKDAGAAPAVGGLSTRDDIRPD